ncbi:hybrid-cluster NAD(P)-dependent oxidoreductase [Motiliproteus sediminis]|uniref:hybrid-cluster NAD(P)-dependent oxidoreductase n=1 Tax=Motiliproteus sediminis TaxID=1468178 RepID=UPI001AEFC2BF|nr:hybrid-cluster NAD(P)-dependent oxidoreductase [Motiliproteus sediminis]
MTANAALFAPLICTGRVEETHDTATFTFRAANQSPFAYKAGQFITFEVEVADQKLHRAYSLSSSPCQPDQVAITVKRVPGGKVSNHLLDHLRPGHMLPGMAPAGEFNALDCPRTDKVLLFSAGSGITPCISIARWLLANGPGCEIDFVYSARNADQVIMAAELDRLAAQDERFRLHRVLGQPAREGDLQGRLDRALFDRIVTEVAGKTLFTCGPESYMAAVVEFAHARGMPAELIHQESFVPASANDAGASSGAQFQLQAPRFGKTVTVTDGQTLLEAMESAGLPVIGACRSGVCGSCKCQLLAGEVEASSTATLTEDEIVAGYRLACSSTIRSDLVVEL